MVNVLYILEALRHNYIMPGLLPGWTRKDIEQLRKFFLQLRTVTFFPTRRSSKRGILRTEALMILADFAVRKNG